MSFNGTPVDDGTIAFVSIDGGTGDGNANGDVKDGKYSLSGERGPKPGKYKVEIYWNKKTGNSATQKYNCGDSSFRRTHIAASSAHVGVANVCFTDGSVRFVRETIDFAAWQAVGTRAGNEPPSNIP